MTACAHLLDGSGNLPARALKLLTIRGPPPPSRACLLPGDECLQPFSDKTPGPFTADRQEPTTSPSRQRKSPAYLSVEGAPHFHSCEEEGSCCVSPGPFISHVHPPHCRTASKSLPIGLRLQPPQSISSNEEAPVSCMVSRGRDFTCALFPVGTGGLVCFLSLTSRLLLYGFQVRTAENSPHTYGPWC